PSQFLSHAFDTFDAEGADFAFEYGLDALISGLEMKKATK
ncbi:TPA: TetR family transcriptional regulator, partial [Escherichia coli]|nr:TetR family transcriptional regulator [Escherichia coli]